MRARWTWVIGSALLGATALVWNSAIARSETVLSAPATIWDDPVHLVEIKAALAAGAGPQEALAKLKAQADKLLKARPASVMDKAKPGPSGDKHDYVSYAPYFWPNPNTADGLPFIQKDGHHNRAQMALGESPIYERLQHTVHTLGLAYWFTGNEAYATHAATLVRTWFLDPATRMNPNFEYAQAIPGVCTGRGIGLIDNRGLVELLDGLALLRGSPAWTAADDKAMHAWIDEFDRWMTTSKKGLAEKKAPNNHGSWYAVQEAGLDLYLGRPDHAKAVLEAVKERIAKQIEPDGRQPREIVREDGFSYSVFNLEALTALADMGRPSDIDLWKFEKDGRGLQKAIDYLMPFAAGQQPWKDKQLAAITPDHLASVVRRAGRAYGDKKYADWLAINHLPPLADTLSGQ